MHLCYKQTSPSYHQLQIHPSFCSMFSVLTTFCCWQTFATILWHVVCSPSKHAMYCGCSEQWNCLIYWLCSSIFLVPFLKQLLLRNCAVDFVEICKVYIWKMMIKAAQTIINSDKICRSYSDLNFGVTSFGTQCISWTIHVRLKSVTDRLIDRRTADRLSDSQWHASLCCATKN